MFRRSSVCRFGYHSHDVKQDQMLAYSPFGWNYLLPQNMSFPWRVNRNMTMPHRNLRAPRAKYTGVWIDIDPMPAVMQEALKPWLSKLALGRSLPPTDPAEAIADFEKISPLLLKNRSQNNNNNNNNNISLEEQTVRSWLAKVLQLCAMKKQNDLGVELWKKFVSASSSSVFLPESNLSTALLYCAAGATSTDAAYFHELFNLCASRQDNIGWNSTQTFSVNLWNSLLYNRALKGDEAGILMIFRELASLQFDVNTLSSDYVVVALNSIKADEHYAEVKEKVLPLFAADRVKVLGYTYTKLRSKAEMAAGASEEEAAAEVDPEVAHSVYTNKTLTHAELPENDKMYYHVSWHSRVRQPMDFMPRRLFFDYKPSMATSKTGSDARKNAKDIVKDRIKTWKEEGLLPEDYDENQEMKFHDSATAYKNSMRSEKWKKTPTFLNTPERSGSLLTSGLAGKGPGGK